MYECPHCTAQIEWPQYYNCPACGNTLSYCRICGFYSPLTWKESIDGLRCELVCLQCSSRISNGSFVRKSSLYRDFRYAFKFINNVHVPYPMYFSIVAEYDSGSRLYALPVGQIQEELGDYVNDYSAEGDPGSARAYRVRLDVSAHECEQTCVVLTHETGLEVFLLAAASYVGLKVADFTLTRTLEAIHSLINDWWKKKRSTHWDKELFEKAPQALVERIAVRTPYWEILLDSSFSSKERRRILDHLLRIAPPEKSVEKFASGVGGRRLVKKIITKSRKSVPRGG